MTVVDDGNPIPEAHGNLLVGLEYQTLVADFPSEEIVVNSLNRIQRGLISLYATVLSSKLVDELNQTNEAVSPFGRGSAK